MVPIVHSLLLPQQQAAQVAVLA